MRNGLHRMQPAHIYDICFIHGYYLECGKSSRASRGKSSYSFHYCILSLRYSQRNNCYTTNEIVVLWFYQLSVYNICVAVTRGTLTELVYTKNVGQIFVLVSNTSM